MAKKKYYQGMKDRMDESRGMSDKTTRRGVVPNESGPEAREETRYFANMPTEVVMKEYPVGFGYPMDQSLYIDNIGGLDKLQNQDQEKVARTLWSPLDRGARG